MFKSFYEFRELHDNFINTALSNDSNLVGSMNMKNDEIFQCSNKLVQYGWQFMDDAGLVLDDMASLSSIIESHST